jgi:hypothetical protein
VKHITSFFALLFIASPFLVSCHFGGYTGIHGDHDLVNERIDILDYEEILLRIPGNVVYQQFSDSTPYLQIHTDKNIFEVLDVTVSGNQLILTTKDHLTIHPSVLTIYTCSHNLKQAKIIGSGDIHLKGEVNAKNFELSITGSGDLLADSLLCENVKTRISGSGDVNLSGFGQKSDFSIAGSGNILARNFFIQKSKCQISGSGNIHVNVNETLDAHITGSGDITYTGNPSSVNSSVSGSGKIKHD